MGFQGHGSAALDALQAFGFCHVSTPAATNIATGGTYVKTAGTTSPGTERDFTHTDNRLTYTGTETRLFAVIVAVSMTSSNNVTTHWRVAVNGTPLASSEQKRLVATGGDVGNASISTEVELSTGDYVEVWCTTEVGEDTKTIQAENMTLTVE
ncbi:hypothetical protein LCGC14_0258840 [marine sediment metagenome]|uniref:Uncharacterized protein n=1 Tax=marine sediment metagenome TaxID=412755 RepID=A0A0F9U752_9ZZZZ